MSTVHIDIVEGTSISETFEGKQVTRIARVFGLAGAKEARIDQALQVTPPFADPHPVVPDIQLMEKHGRAVDTQIVEVSLVYRRPKDGEDLALLESTGQPELTGGTVTENVSRDINGNRMTVSYRGPIENFGSDLVGGTIVDTTNLLSVNVQRPQIELILSRYENTLPLDLAEEFTGKINSTRWAGRPARTWLALQPRATYTQGRFLVQWPFAYNKDTWVASGFVEYLGRRPIDAEIGRGFEQFDVYEQIDFNRLGLNV